MPVNQLRRWAGGLPVPPQLPSSTYFRYLLGLVFLVAAVGLQIMLTLLLAIPAPEVPTGELSDWGILYVHPEYDVVLYVAGVALTLLAVLAVTLIKSRRTTGASAGAMVLRFAVATLGTAVVVWRFLGARASVSEGTGIPLSYYLTLALVGAVSVAALGRRADRLSTPIDRWLERLPGATGPVGDPAGRFSVFDLLIPVALVALVYVPTWREVAGRVFQEENFLHWDYFIMGPALSFRNGHALGTDIYSAYGVGWPMVFGALSEWLPLSYGRFIQAGSLYACVYLTGVYVLLRTLRVRPLLAALGTLLAFLPFFLWMYGLTIWRTPNVTPLRWAFDVWCLIALVRHFKSRRRFWAVAAGGLLGMAILFAIDTGFELLVAFAFYWVWLLWAERTRRLPVDLAVSLGAAVVSFLAGAAVASRGTLFQPRFWWGWAEAPLEFGGGFGMLPVGTWPNGNTIVAFSILVALYLVVCGYAFVRMLHRKIGTFELFTGVVSLYGLVVLVKFLGHSDRSIFPRLLTPAVIVVILIAGRGYEYLRQGGLKDRRPGRALRLGSVGLAVAVVMGLAAAPRSLFWEDFLAYPGWVSNRLSGAETQGGCLYLEPRDVCGLPPGLEQPAEEFRAITGVLKGIEDRGETFAVIDETGSLFYVPTESAPFGRYGRIFLATHTKQLVNDMEQDLIDAAPDYILIRTRSARGGMGYEAWNVFGLGPDPASYYNDVWEQLGEIVKSDYRLEQPMLPYELWRRTDRPA